MCSKLFVHGVIAAFSLGLAGVAAAQPVGASFTSGLINGAGFPEPLATSPGAMTATSGSGGGSTGGGLPNGGEAIAAASFTVLPGSTRLRVLGSSEHMNSNGYTSAFSQNTIIFELTEAANYTIANTSTLTDFNTGNLVPLNPVILSALTGTITGDSISGSLEPGTYSLQFAVMAGSASAFPTFDANYAGYTEFGFDERFSSASVDWRMDLVAVPAPGTACLLGGLLLVSRRRR